MPTTEAQLPSPAPCYKGRASMSASYSSLERRSFAFSYWVGVDILLQDRTCAPDVVGRFKQLLNNLLGSPLPLLGFIDACSAIREDLCQHGEWNGSRIRTLKHRWVGSLCSAIEFAYQGIPIVHPSRAFDQIVTFLGWLKRLPVCIRPVDEGVQDYIQNDTRLSSINFDDNVYVPGLREIWFEWFRSFELKPPFLPKHGSGSTADSGRVRAKKWAQLRSDTVARVCLRYADLTQVQLPPKGRPSRRSKVVFVPKQAGKDRTICMEPAWLQFLQQGIASQLIAHTHKRSHPLSRYVNIYSQEVNRCLCAQALWRNLATIDLSNASDSVSWRLIGALCKGLPIYRYLFASRSTSTLIEGTERIFDKFAPMGSALCFPIESFLFASVVELAYRIHYGKAGKGHLSGCSVYGDDIIVPVELYQLVIEILESLGFQVNTKKSFSSGIYRESCGVEYLDGVLINTIKHPRSHLFREKGVASPDDIGMITDIANDLLRLGYRKARRRILKEYEGYVIRIGSRLKPFKDFLVWGDQGIISLNESLCDLRWDGNIQRWYRVQKSIQATPRSTRYDVVEYFHNRIGLSREERLRRRRCLPKSIDVDERWSEKGTIALLKLGHFDLLQEGDVRVVGSCGTGRLHYREVKIIDLL